LYTITFGRGSSDEASFIITGGILLMLDSKAIIAENEITVRCQNQRH
jgi:hypothetical protein